MTQVTPDGGPEYVFAVEGLNRKAVGSFAFAPGLFRSPDQAAHAIVRFIIENTSHEGAINVHTVDTSAQLHMMEKAVTSIKAALPKPDVNLHAVLMDKTHTNDCCVKIVTQFCGEAEALKADDEVICDRCHSTWRYVNDGEGNYAWLWRLPKKYTKASYDIYPLADLFNEVMQREADLDKERAQDRLDVDEQPPRFERVAVGYDPQYSAGNDPLTGEPIIGKAAPSPFPERIKAEDDGVFGPFLDGPAGPSEGKFGGTLVKSITPESIAPEYRGPDTTRLGGYAIEPYRVADATELGIDPPSKTTLNGPALPGEE